MAAPQPGETDWRRYGPCPVCEAPESEPCVSFSSKIGNRRQLKNPHAQRRADRRGGFAAIPDYYVETVNVGGKTKYAVMRARNGRHRSVVTYLRKDVANRAMGHLIELAPDEV